MKKAIIFTLVACFTSSMAFANEAPAVTKGDAAKGKALSAVCAACHGADGKGTPMVGPQINGYDIHNALAKGKKGKIGRMPAFSTLITPVQEKALTAYAQSLAN